MPITTKEYKCEKCGSVTKIQTNHDGSFRGCKSCNDKRAYLVCQTEEGIKLHNRLQTEKQALRAVLPQSILRTTKQVKKFTKIIRGGKAHMNVYIQWDDTCGNNHNSFSITADIYGHPTSESDRVWESGGCQHDKIAKHFPKFKHLINWHYFNADGYEYVDNITYFAKGGNLESARKCANWEDATIEQLMDKEVLMERLPSLMQQLKSDLEALGLIY